MSIQREVLTGVFAALTSIIIIAGSFAVATTESRSTTAQTNMLESTLTSFPTHIILVTQRPGEPTYTPSPSPLPSLTATQAVLACIPPAGWSEIVLQPGDSLESLAQTYNTTPAMLQQANCLIGNSILPGTFLYVPGAPPPTPIPCGPPLGWVYYIVKQGDTLYSIGRAYSVSVSQLQTANCLGSSTIIRVGQKLYVPNVTPIQPSSTPTIYKSPSPEPTLTQTPIPPSLTPIPTTNTPTMPTDTVSVPTEALTSTDTPIPPTVTVSVPTGTPTSTDTPIPPTDTVIPPTETFTLTPATPINTMVPTSVITTTTTSLMNMPLFSQGDSLTP